MLVFHCCQANYCKLSGLNNTNLILYHSEGQKSEMGLNVLKKKKCPSGCVSSGRSRGEFMVLSFLAPWAAFFLVCGHSLHL